MNMIWRTCGLLGGLFLLGSILPSTIALAVSPELETKSFIIPSVDPGVELYMRNKHPVEMTNFSADRTVLFIHGATYPAETSFDLPIEGVSMMDLIAQQGYDVFLVDVRGYGGSTRSAEFSQPAAANKPLFDLGRCRQRPWRCGRLYLKDEEHSKTGFIRVVMGNIDRRFLSACRT
jgi:pimeloyl-ACP methyl ester carboxylesterase